ncbi:hypothetical protein Tsubulata_037512 [Turnera subulata]|uniref:Uncharacterized protein n=1 Tax=Turnera subulata TaxID=218843 RepID=A0A9Q0JII3_9ROSI|nr:hypothetical protein Tsubulata_037512 [Turnera subulata]
MGRVPHIQLGVGDPRLIRDIFVAIALGICAGTYWKVSYHWPASRASRELHARIDKGEITTVVPE